jgi:lysophospholipase L1-like esterase
MLFEPVGTAPSVALSSIVSGLWIGASFLPRWRATLLEIGRLLIARIGFVVWLLAALLLLLLAATRGSLGLGLAISAALLTAAAAAEALRRDRTRFAFTLVLLALNAVLLVALNAFVGAFVLPARSHNNVVTEHDPLLGWKLRRGLSIERHRDAYSSRETINRHGFRTAERPFEKPAGTQRIVLLGDSHTEAYTVNDDETYAVLLEQELSADRPVEVIALGVGGYSTDQELLAYLNLGRRFQPDVVVLQFCMNDLPYNVLEHYWRGRKPRFERYGDALMLTGVPVPNLRNTGLFGSELISRWSLVLFLETALRQLAIKRDVEEKVDPEEAWRVTELLLRDLNAAVASDGAQLVVFLVDRNTETETGLRRILDRHAIPFLDTASTYTDDFESYWVDGHWNQKGQRAVAQTLAPPLRAALQSKWAANE